METILLLIKLLLLSWFITSFEPIQMLLDLLPDKIYWNILKLITSCLKCCAFWITFIYTGDIFMASGISLVAAIFDKTINSWLHRVRLN